MRPRFMETTIYMPLLDEGTDVWRPVTAEDLGSGRYRVTTRTPGDEVWSYPSGAIVIVDDAQRIIAETDA